jgi:hypothetical protein
VAEPILLIHWRAPGDITCMTACVRDLALTCPGKYQIHVAGSCASLWEHNPYVSKVWGAAPPRDIPTYRLSYLDGLRDSGHRRLHFLTAFHRNLAGQLNVDVPVLYPKGDLHLSREQREKNGLFQGDTGTSSPAGSVTSRRRYGPRPVFRLSQTDCGLKASSVFKMVHCTQVITIRACSG